MNRHVQGLRLWLLSAITALSLSANTQATDAECTEILYATNLHAQVRLATSAEPAQQTTLPGTDQAYPRTSSYCLRMRNASATTKTVILYFDNPRLQHAELLLQTGTGPVLTGMAGLDYPLPNWKSLGGEMLFAVELPTGMETMLDLRIASRFAYNSTLHIMPEELFQRQLARQQILAGLLTGFIMSLTLYTLFLGVNNRDKTYFYLSGSTASVMLLQLSDLGSLYPLWPTAIYWNQVSATFFAALSTTFGCCLARSYLLTAESMPRTDKALNLFTWYLFLVTLPLTLTTFDMAIVLLYALPAITVSFALLAISFLRMRQGYDPARLYLVALILPVIAGLSILFTFIGWLPSSPMVRILPLAGTALQLVMFALALGERINWLENEHKASKEQALLAQAETETKKNFLAQISHEFRTPLIGIVGLTELLDRKAFNNSDRILLDGLSASATHLLNTINTLLDHARIDAGKWQLQDETFAIRTLLSGILEQHRKVADSKNLGLRLQIHENVPEQLLGDIHVLSKILDHILNNAIKFTHNGGIVLIVEATKKGEHDVVLRFDILDTGIGFNELFKARAFELFELADSSTTRDQQGLGLGLSLCRKFCTLLGGNIGCDSNMDHGTVFWCTLPFRLPAQVVQAGSNELASSADATHNIAAARRKLLIAEDDEALQMIMADILEKLGENFAIFPNGKPLVEEYRRDHDNIDCILLDWNMPVCNASDAISAIRACERSLALAPVPIVIMTAYDRHSANELALSDDTRILYKPLDKDKLAFTLSSCRNRDNGNKTAG